MSTWDLALITPPAIEPIAVDEAKLHLRVDAFDEDYLINSVITVARQYVEQVTGRALITQTWDEYLQGWPCGDEILLHRGPVQSVASVNIKDTAGTETAVATTVYIADVNRDPARVALAYSQSWPNTTLYPASPIRIRYMAGYGATAASVPTPIKQALLLLIGHWFQFREAVLGGKTKLLAMNLPMGVGALLENYRMWA